MSMISKSPDSVSVITNNEANNILDLANPYFTYDKGLVIPVSADAFSSEQLKDMLKDIIFDLNDKFLDRDIDHIIVIYLLRGYVVRLNIK